jgi:hypothetical protein
MKRSRLKKGAGAVFHVPKKRRLMKYEIVYRTRPYGKKSSMLALKSEFAGTPAEAKNWVKILKADQTAKDIEIVKLKKSEWF